MGVLTGRDLLTPKYITAEITDSEDRVHYVPIKHTLGDYFIVDLDGKIFAFTLRNARILIHRRTMTKSFRVIQYDTSHYSSLKPETKGLQILLEKNSLPKVNRLMYDIFRVFSRREKKDFKPHNIEQLVNEFSQEEEKHKANSKYREEIINIKKYLEELDVTEIVTPVRKITDFITEDLIATSPSFLGEMVSHYQRLDVEHRKITNTPVKSTGGIMKIMVIAMACVAIVVGVIYAADQGVFDGLSDFGKSISTIGEGLEGLPSPTQGFQTSGTGADYSDATIQAKYAGCETLKSAINSGEIDYNKLSSFMKELVDLCPEPEEVIP